MSSSVGRNSLIMASGTAASRITGQLRTILLAAAIGTTGLAANAYQAGSMIPQSVFTLVSGGIFNAVLVPQIVRTMKEEDAQERLNRLITLAIGLLLAMTLLMTVCAPLLTMLYVGGGDHQMMALTTAFTLWCMPQVFFYGLYTVLGQILAARDHFATYAWSSTGANVISCAGFTAFIMLFGKANEQPLDFWTADKIALTAGTWTLGVAFQALILFVPLARLGFKYRPSFGLSGFGLKAMGPVALGSLGVVIASELCGIVLSRVTTMAPQYAHELTGASLFTVAGNATYQNAYTLFILPYSLIAVSVSTAIFPKISRAVADNNLDEARHDLGSALSNVGLLLMFFGAAMVVFPEPIIRALLPSVSMNETMLISYALVALAIGIPMGAAFLLIQRTFYAFEDGLHPFLSALVQYTITAVLIVAGTTMLPPEHWVTWSSYAVTISSLVALPVMVTMLRKRFGGYLGGRAIALTYGKALAAAVAAGAVTWLVKQPLTVLFGVRIQPVGGHMSWFSAIGICVVLTAVLFVVYVAMLWALRTPELNVFVRSLRARFGRFGAGAADGAAPDASAAATEVRDAASPESMPADTSTDHHGSADPTDSAKPNASSSLSMSSPRTMRKASPTDRMSTLRFNTTNNRTESDEPMKPHLGDTILNRYTLVSSLREEPGLEAWKANDRVLARDCQLFIISDRGAFAAVNELAGQITANKPNRVSPVLKYRMESGVMLIIMPLDEGQSLTEYFGDAGKPLSYSAMHSILGECTDVMRSTLTSASNLAINTDTVRVTTSGVQIADAPCTPMIVDTCGVTAQDSPERHAIRQLAALLYAMLTHAPVRAGQTFDLGQLPADTPGEFRVICKRGLELSESDETTLPMATLVELEALLGDWKPLNELDGADIALSSIEGRSSIGTAALKPVEPAHIVAMPSTLVDRTQLPELSIGAAGAAAGIAGAAGVAGGAVPLPEGKQDARRLFDFNLSDAWQHENLSGEDTGDWYNEMNPAPTGGPGDNSRLTVPIAVGGLSDTTVGETTSRIPVFDASGREVMPGEESLRALEEEQARIAEVSAVPPSFEPKETAGNTRADNKLPDEHLLGTFTTKAVAIVVALVLVIAAAFWAVHAFQSSGVNPADPQSNTAEGEWPDIDTNDVPFGSNTSGDNTDSTSSDTSTDSSSNSTKSESTDTSTSTEKNQSKSDQTDTSDSQQSTSKKKTTADKDAKAVPTPRHVNNTAYTIASANFLTNPGGQQGYAYHLHLDQAHDVYRMTVTIRTSGGTGYIRANTTEDPTKGEQVAKFTFAEGGTTEVKFDKTINTQDLILWVPVDSLPQNQLYIQKVEVF
ncbi:murein biosynthesis integral membrane protein MurJ [Bifidobacterium scaligerum]|uniref:Virulence factor protein n=1 Tax=Bifidobacterium scaligerum TaxID=2052656 RepID=A0A2M9HNB2_9BIFI|nr:murein biosynthesis integral membrane protein MurJ [Bifidobacterium scaligerum]PJM78312.1 hypothetical protein CUU80_10135 [Bifidobacterium scaligerum]